MMMRTAVMLCGLGLMAGFAVAQDETPPPPPSGQMQGPPPGGRGGMMDPGRRADRMKHELGLSDDQTTQVKSILEDGRTKMEALRSNTSMSREDRRSQMTTIRQAQNDKIHALLTADQKTKYDAMQAKEQERTQGRRDRGQAPGGDTTPAPPPAPPPPPPQN
jgi:Spy/CpxP family protein refolding chaperone